MSGIKWVYTMLVIYTIYCLYCGLKGYFTEKTSEDYTIAGRSIPFFVFLMAGTGACFSGWTFVGHPGAIWKFGLAYSFASFYVITIPITGAFFSKRTWLMGKRYGFVTPGDMYAYYYNSESIRWLVVATAMLYAIFYSAVQIMASAALLKVICDVPVTFGAFFMGFIVWFYVCTGGFRASTWMGVIQFVLVMGGICVLGYYVVNAPEFGGWRGFSSKLMELESKYLEVPKIIDVAIRGKGWTAIFIMTYIFSLMGIQSSPAFTMWTFGIKNPRPLAWQQAFMSSFVVGFALFFFGTFQGMGAKILQTAGVEGFAALKSDTSVVPLLMRTYLPPLMLGLVFIGAISAIHSAAAPHIGTGGSILLRDIYWRHIKKQRASDAEQIRINRLFTTILILAALGVGMASKAVLVILGALAAAFGFVMYILLLGTLWGFKFPRAGSVLGVLAGMVAVFITFSLIKNPLSIHSAAWGTGIGFLVAYLCRGIGIEDDAETIERQQEVREWLDSVDEPSKSGKIWRKAMKIVVPLWFFFAIGPACILSNKAFSFAGFPPVWSWQITWWILGVIMMWALCFKAEMATATDLQIKRADSEKMTVVKEHTDINNSKLQEN